MTITIDRRQESIGDEYTDLRVWLRMEAPEGAPGLRWISFLLLGDDGLDLFAGRKGDFADGYHNLKCFGELWTFCNLDTLLQDGDAGEASVSYRRVTVPIPVQKMILADIEEAARAYDAQGGKREEIRIDYSGRLAGWSDYYGRGKGQIVVDGPESEIVALKGEKTFDRSWDNIERIARNTTHSKSDQGLIKVYRESPTAFMWSAGSLHGGLINHGDENAPDWSVHT
jgi:hypothetical protein